MAEVEWNRLTATELRELAAEGATVLVPIGSTEQHGPHLPTGVDDFLAKEVCTRAAVKARRKAVVAPSVWCGLAEHHMAFGGTFTLSLATLHALLRDICRSILRTGFQTIVIVNGHGGNVTALNALATELTVELQTRIGVTSYFTIGDRTVRETLEAQETLMHACEGETSMMLAAHPDLVRIEELDKAVGPRISLPAGSAEPVYFPVSFEEISAVGVAGDARKATAAKGEKLLAGCAQALADWLDATR
ncbi:creatininase family protein [Kutzneria sp. CA-103260]|uniref:creatininase family protein n=1 Tax=Kutzneria sp. CA-103260 TaxID=2802641 RepID=UPI001BAE4896|nr:creatininase family protein [Kutzneria sp. CA-103260]QUQ66015.1 creatinine amidohydrolase [Kutzneria sp. CA-103260]